MRILLTGASGLVGSNIYLRLKSPKLFAPPRHELDITNSGSVRKYFDEIKPKVVIHAAAAVGTIEGKKEKGNKNSRYWKANVEGTENIVTGCKSCGAYLIYISSEVVFSGWPENPGPYGENTQYDKDEKSLSWYGLTKRKGEEIIREKYPKSAIIRLSRTAGSKNPAKLDLLQKILKDYEENKIEPKFTDQYFGLTDFADLAKALKKLINKRFCGIFHVSSNDQLTPYELAEYILFKIEGVSSVVKPARIVEYLEKFPNSFLQFGGLKSTKTQKLLEMRFASCWEIVDLKIEELKNFYS